MARRSSHNHNIPTVSLKSNYKIDGRIELTGELYVNGKPVSSGGNYYEAGDGIDIVEGKITINDTYIKDIIASVDRDVNDTIQNVETTISKVETKLENIDSTLVKISSDVDNLNSLSQEIEAINLQINNEETGLGALSEKISDLEVEINTLKNLPKFSVKVEQELPKELEEGVIYLIPAKNGGYDEYISYKNSEGTIVAELIGSSNLDNIESIIENKVKDYITENPTVIHNAVVESTETYIQQNKTVIDEQITEALTSEVTQRVDAVIAEKNIDESIEDAIADAVGQYDIEGKIDDRIDEIIGEVTDIGNTIIQVEKNTADISSIKERLEALEKKPDEDEEDTLQYGEEYATFAELINNKASLKENTIYRVTDKNTIEEYILKDGKIEQISGNFNNQITEDMLDENGVSPMKNTIVNNEIAYNMPELVIGDYMFSGCDNLYSFVSDTPCLTSGIEMFKGCINLESFCGILSSLENGTDMFSGCALDLDSILNIVESINDSVIGEATITIGYNDEVVDGETIAEFDKELKEKGWTVIWEKKSNITDLT